MSSFARTRASFRSPVVVERRPVVPGPRAALLLTKLPVPPAANNLFFNDAHANGGRGGRAKSQRYRAWRVAAGWQVRLQSPRRVPGPVAISITVEEGASRADLDNLAKAPIDLLCELHLIEGDHRDVIRELNLRWGAVEGLSIEVKPA